jgi:soluble lytic murein transglycosylase
LRWAYLAYLEQAYPLKYGDIVERYASEYDLPPSLIYAVIHTESRFHADAESSAGAKGLMQLMDTTYAWIQTKIEGVDEPPERIFDPEINVRCGAKVLQVMHQLFPETETALAAYNAGNGTVSKWLSNTEYSSDGKTLIHIPYTETANYVERVVNTQKRYQELYGID